MRRTALAVAMNLLVLGACGGGAGKQVRRDVPEPAVAGAADTQPPGASINLGSGAAPEGLAFDPKTGLLAVAVREPDGVALVDIEGGSVRTRVPLAGAARHLALAGPGGPVLVPSEGNDRLYEIALPGGVVTADIGVGRQPHDAAAAAGGSVFVGDELADTVHIVAPDGSSRVVAGPVQPGGVASSPDGATVVVVGVRGRQIQAYAADGRTLGSAACGVGPTHVRAGENGLFYVADTQGNALLVFETTPSGIKQIGRVAVAGAPYGLAVDLVRKRLYVTLTATNTLRAFRIDARELRADRSWPTVRQPNDVAITTSGQVVVAGTADGVLQVLQP